MVQRVKSVTSMSTTQQSEEVKRSTPGYDADCARLLPSVVQSGIEVRRLGRVFFDANKEMSQVVRSGVKERKEYYDPDSKDDFMKS